MRTSTDQNRHACSTRMNLKLKGILSRPTRQNTKTCGKDCQVFIWYLCKNEIIQELQPTPKKEKPCGYHVVPIRSGTPSHKHAKFSSPSSAFSELCRPCAAWKPAKTPRKPKLRSRTPRRYVASDSLAMVERSNN